MIDSPRTVIGVVSAATVASYLPLFLLGALAVQLQADLAFGASVQGVLVSSFNLTVAVAAVPLSRIAIRVGWVRSLRWACLALASGMLGIAVGARSWPALAALLLVCSIANSAVLPSGNVAIVGQVAARRRGVAFGIRQASVPLAVLLGGLAVPLVAVPLGWRPVYVLAALVPAAVVVATRRVHDATVGARPAGGRHRPQLTTSLALLFVLSGTGAMLVNAGNAFLATTAVASGIDPAAAGLLLVLGSAVTLIVRLAVGVLVDRVSGLGGLGIIAALLTVATVGFLLIAGGSRNGIVVGTVLGVGAGSGWPGVLHYVVSNEHPEGVAAVASTMLACANVGGFVGPLVFGLVVDHASYAAAWVVLAASAAGGVCCVLVSARGLAARRPAQLLAPDGGEQL